MGRSKSANFLVTGHWSNECRKEASKFCDANIVSDSAENNFTLIDDPVEWNIKPDAAFFHYCDNETANGLELVDFPYQMVPQSQILIADMSSSIATRRIDWDNYGVVYASAQKNLGAAGLTVVFVRRDLIGRKWMQTPTLCDWELFSNSQNGFFNTPSVYSVYITGLNVQHLIAKGGVE